MKHKHADLIHAWADGAEIQVFKQETKTWQDMVSPYWFVNEEYRIKPEEKKPVVRWLWANKAGKSYWLTSQVFATEQEAAMNKLPLIKLEWSRTEFES